MNKEICEHDWVRDSSRDSEDPKERGLTCTCCGFKGTLTKTP